MYSSACLGIKFTPNHSSFPAFIVSILPTALGKEPRKRPLTGWSNSSCNSLFCPYSRLPVPSLFSISFLSLFPCISPDSFIGLNKSKCHCNWRLQSLDDKAVILMTPLPIKCFKSRRACHNKTRNLIWGLCLQVASSCWPPSKFLSRFRALDIQIQIGHFCYTTGNSYICNSNELILRQLSSIVEHSRKRSMKAAYSGDLHCNLLKTYGWLC